jgi:hypothetical protein
VNRVPVAQDRELGLGRERVPVEAEHERVGVLDLERLERHELESEVPHGVAPVPDLVPRERALGAPIGGGEDVVIHVQANARARAGTRHRGRDPDERDRASARRRGASGGGVETTPSRAPTARGPNAARAQQSIDRPLSRERRAKR